MCVCVCCVYKMCVFSGVCVLNECMCVLCMLMCVFSGVCVCVLFGTTQEILQAVSVHADDCACTTTRALSRKLMPLSQGSYLHYLPTQVFASTHTPHTHTLPVHTRGASAYDTTSGLALR